MENQSSDKPVLTDIAKTALRDAGVISQLKQAIYSNDSSKTDDSDALKGKAQAMADDLQQMIDGGTLNDADTQKLNSILTRLRGVLQGGSISREALVMALSEASTAINAASATAKSVTEQQKTDQLWQEIEKHNKNIDDDFEKMQQVGIVFDDKLMEKHKRLLEYLQAHPQDIEKQKELNAVDDQMLQQAEPQLGKHPTARYPFDDAKKESEERHQKVDHDLAAVKKSALEFGSNTDLDWDAPAQEKSKPSGNSGIKDVTMNDVETPNISQKPRNKANIIS